MENVVGRRLALLAGWGAVLLFLLDPRSAVNTVHAPVFFLIGVLLGPICAWGAMLAADFETSGARKFSASSALELLSASTLAFFLIAFALSWIGVPGL
jgi:hypothetical protein